MLQFALNCGQARAWKAMTAELGKWWPESYLCAHESKGIRLETKLGGRLFETDGKRGGLVWYTVNMIDPGRSITMVGHCGPPFGGPSTSILKLSLAGTRTTSMLTVNDELFGRVSPSMAKSILTGWEYLFGQGLQAYIERLKERATKQASKARKVKRGSRRQTGS